MTELRTETLRLPMADLGEVNPLPPLGPVVQPYRLAGCGRWLPSAV